MTTLKEIFPNMSHTTIEEVYDDGKDVNEMIDVLSNYPSQSLIVDINNKSKKRLQVDEESCMEDCLAFYKNPTFDPFVPLRISFSGLLVF